MFGVTWQQRALMHCFVASCNDMYCYLAFRQITFSASFAAQLLHRCKSTKIQWRRNLFAKIYQQRNGHFVIIQREILLNNRPNKSYLIYVV